MGDIYNVSKKIILKLKMEDKPGDTVPLYTVFSCFHLIYHVTSVFYEFYCISQSESRNVDR